MPVNIIDGYTFLRELCAALGEDPKDIHRIVIDAQAGDVVRVYIERFASDILLRIQFPSPDGISIVQVGKDISNDGKL